VAEDGNNKNIMPTIVVVFGATGDLMTKKIVPALYHLYKDKKLPEHFKIIGFSRRNLNDEELDLFILNIINDIKIRMRKYISLFQSNLMSIPKITCSIQSWLGYAVFANSFHLRRKLFSNILIKG